MPEDDKKEDKELMVVEPTSQSLAQRDPEAEIQFGHRAAKALMGVIESKKKKVQFNGNTYLTFEDWQTLARFFNLTVGIEWTKNMVDAEGATSGFFARSTVKDQTGREVSSAESSCSREEPNWKIKPEFQLRSMAQTRACAKALRNILSWVVVLAGYEPTPAEEMDHLASEVDNKFSPPPAHRAEDQYVAPGKPSGGHTAPVAPVAPAPAPAPSGRTGGGGAKLTIKQRDLIAKLADEKLMIDISKGDGMKKLVAMVNTKYKMSFATIDDLDVSQAKKLIDDLINSGSKA